MTRQAASDRQQNVRWWGLFQVSAWHDHSYIAGIPLLTHGLTVKVSPCPCSHSSPAEWIASCQHVRSTICGYPKSNLLQTQARPRMMQHLASKITHWMPISFWVHKLPSIPRNGCMNRYVKKESTKACLFQSTLWTCFTAHKLLMYFNQLLQLKIDLV